MSRYREISFNSGNDTTRVTIGRARDAFCIVEKGRAGNSEGCIEAPAEGCIGLPRLPESTGAEIPGGARRQTRPSFLVASLRCG